MSRKELSTPTLIPPSKSGVIRERIQGERDRLTYYERLPERMRPELERLQNEINKLCKQKMDMQQRFDDRPVIVEEIKRTIAELNIQLAEAMEVERASNKTTLLGAPVAFQRPSWMSPEVEAALRAAGQDPAKIARAAKGGGK